MLIRKATNIDLVDALMLYAQLNPQDSAVTDGRDVEVLARITTSEDLHLFVGDLENRIVTICYLNLIPNLSRDASPYGIIENVVTERTLRNRGLEEMIMAHALDVAFDNRCYKVMLQTGSNRSSPHRFYRSYGFVGDDKHAFLARPGMSVGEYR